MNREVSPPAMLLREAPSSWGDYGHILAHGMSRHLPRQDGRIQLERTGPFIPPISFPGVGDLLVTDVVRLAMERQGLTGMHFAPVHLARIVRLDWCKWDRNADRPAKYPKDGVPEAYILEAPHDPDAARELGVVWECVLDRWGTAKSEIVSRRPIASYVSLTADSTEMPDFFRARGVRHAFVSRNAQAWLDASLGEWIRFQPIGSSAN
jgi:hypothetical protein